MQLLDTGEQNCIREAIAHQLRSSYSQPYKTIIDSNLPGASYGSARRIYNHMLRSHFCLQPPGDTYSRRGLYDSIMLGCIPVVFSKEVLNTLPWKDSSLRGLADAIVYIPHEEVCGRIETSRAINIPKYLVENFSGAERMALREVGLRYLRALQYSSYQEEYNDAFGLLLEDLKEIVSRHS